MHMWRRRLVLCISYKMKYLQNEARKQKSIKEVTLQFSMIFQIRLKNNNVNFRVIYYALWIMVGVPQAYTIHVVKTIPACRHAIWYKFQLKY